MTNIVGHYCEQDKSSGKYRLIFCTIKSLVSRVVWLTIVLRTYIIPGYVIL